MNKLEKINNAISEIREILGSECADIDQLPDMVRSLTSDSGRNGFTTAFIFSSEMYPNTPTGGSLDPTTGLVTGLEEGWSQFGNKPSTYNMRSTPAVTNNWMSFAIFDPSGNPVTEWSSPMNLKGAQGEQGIQGEPGDEGKQGPPGEEGKTISYRTVSVYTTTATTDLPYKPIGGFWDLSTNKVTPPSSDGDTKWYLNADEPLKDKYLWLSQATFNETGNIINNWCEPFRLTGEDGKNGADGKVTEFIYRLLPDYETYKALLVELDHNPLYSAEYEDDKVPEVNDSLNIGTVWTDQPKGISEELQVEVCCTRTRKKMEDPWSEWSKCIMWAKWGEDGMDGDGVEYIYLVTAKSTADGEITSEYVEHYLMPDLTTVMSNPRYQESEFCLNDEWGVSGYDWTDEPSDVGEGKPMEWVSTRKQINGVWGAFSKPTLWARYSADGAAYLTSFVFTRASIDNPPTRPEGGSLDVPRPDGEIWKDTVPNSDTNLPVWMSTRTFSNNPDFDTTWTEPRIWGDTSDFQVEYYHGDNYPMPLTKFNGNEEEWRKENPGWGDDIEDPIWMATCNSKNGSWTDWTVTRIKGEKGDVGERGSSVQIKHKVATLNELITQWEEWLNGGWFFDSGELNGGDGVFVEEDGMLYSYSGEWYPGEKTDFEIYWMGVEIKGEPGKSANIYIAYTDEPIEGTKVDLTNPKKWVGIASPEKPFSQEEQLDWHNYKWSRWQGQDGYGQEQIFLSTSATLGFDPSTGKHPPLPANNEPVSGYLPYHEFGDLAYPNYNDPMDPTKSRWSDTPSSVSKEYPFCWVATRKVQGDSFGPWIGDNGKAALYSRWSYDRTSAVSVDLTNNVAIIPSENGKIDLDYTEDVTTTVRVYTGDEIIDSNDYEVYSESDLITIEGSLITLNRDKSFTGIQSIPINVEMEGKIYTVEWKLLLSNVAYELTPSIHFIKRISEGPDVGKLETKEITVKIKKWVDNKWIVTNIPVFAELEYLDGGLENLSTTDGSVIIDSGVATIKIGDRKSIKAITIFIVRENSEGKYMSDGERISWEDIAIISDGETGITPDAYFKSFVFKRSAKPLTKDDSPSGGSYDDPVPSGWEDGVPPGTEQLWASTRTFCTDSSKDDPEWSIPKAMSDTVDFDVTFSSEIVPGSPDTNPGNWDDKADETTIWMATRNGKNGEWNEWQISKIKGEKGVDGTSIKINGSYDTLDQFKQGAGGSNLTKKPENLSYCYIVARDLYTWDGDNWVNAGQFTGDPGKSNFIHVKYANTVSTDSTGKLVVDLTTPDGESPGKFMGICIDENPDDPTDLSEYKWTKSEGDDGFGYEYIYQLNDNENAPAIPTEKTEDDIAPKDWTDGPSGVSETKRYEWVCWRKKMGGEWSEWFGSKENVGYASLWAKYGEKGEKGDQGDQGPKGEDGKTGDPGIVTQLTNPSSTILIVNHSVFSSTVTESNLRAIKGTEFGQITDVSILKVNINGELDNNNLIVLSTDLADSAPFNDNILQFRLKDGVKKEEQTIEITVQFTAFGKTFTEVKTILIRHSAENAMHLELSQDSYNISLSKSDHNNISQAILYSGSMALGSGVTYSSSRSDATVDKVTINESGVISLDKTTIDTTNTSSVSVTITATHNNKSYTKTFVLTKNSWDVWLSTLTSVINLSNPVSIAGRVMQNSSVFTKSEYYNVYYVIDGKGSEIEISTEEGEFVIPKDVVKTVQTSLEIILRDSKGNLYDKESIGVVKNGNNAQYLQIDANHTLITKKSDGTIVSPNEQISPIFYYIDGNKKEVVDYNKIDEMGYCVWKYLVKPDSSPTKVQVASHLPTSCLDISTQLIYYLCKKDVVDPISNFEDYVEIDVITSEKGEDGNNGSFSPIIYPAGEWENGKTYEGNKQRAPYVSIVTDDSVSYYIACGTLQTKPSSDNTVPSNESVDWSNPINKWIEMENYNAIYADIGIMKEALVGKWVFHGDYMFSQEGVLKYYTDENGIKYLLYYRGNDKSNQSCTYEAALYRYEVVNITDKVSQPSLSDNLYMMNLWQRIESEIWIPNICFNSVTGEGWFAGKKMHFKNDEFKMGEISITDDGELLSVDPDTESKISFGNGHIILSEYLGSGMYGDAFILSTRSGCDSSEFSSYINIEDSMCYPEESHGPYVNMKSRIALGYGFGEEVVSIRDAGGFFAGFKPTYEIITMNGANPVLETHSFTQVYYIKYNNEYDIKINLNNYRIPGVYYEFYCIVAANKNVSFYWDTSLDVDEKVYNNDTDGKKYWYFVCQYTRNGWTIIKQTLDDIHIPE